MGPNERNVLVGDSSLRSGFGPLLLDDGLRHDVKLRQKRLPVDVDGHSAKTLFVARRCFIIMTQDGVEVEICKKERPFALDVFELPQFFRLVVQASFAALSRTELVCIMVSVLFKFWYPLRLRTVW